MFGDIKTKGMSYMEWELMRLQGKADKLYEKEGLTDKVLKLQLFINSERNKFDIHDKSEEVYEEFVQ